MSQMPSSFAGRVVVGYDGSEVASHALDWAASYAAARSLPLTVITAVQLAAPTMGDGSWYAPATDMLEEVAERDLQGGLQQLAASHPDVSVEGHIGIDSPARLLIDASETAAVTVVGSRGRSELGGLVLGSVSNAVAAHGHGAVIVVSNRMSRDFGGPIVVGSSDSPDGREALRFALRTASEVGAPLKVVRAWGALRSWSMSEADHRKLSGDIERNAADTLAELVEELSPEFPDVQVTQHVVHGSPDGALVQTSAGASMVVVGSRGLGGFRGLLLGSTSRTVLHSSTVPVAVVHARKER